MLQKVDMVLLSTLLPKPNCLCNGVLMWLSGTWEVSVQTIGTSAYCFPILTQLSTVCRNVICLCHYLHSPPRGFQMYHRAGPPGQYGLDHGGVCILVRDHVGHGFAASPYCITGCCFQVSSGLPIYHLFPLSATEHLSNCMSYKTSYTNSHRHSCYWETFMHAVQFGETWPPITWGKLLKTFLHRVFAVF